MSDIKYDFGLIGLGVMGKNFILNVADHGFGAMGYDLDQEKVDTLIKEGVGKKVTATTDLSAFLGQLALPRKIMLLVPAGKPVDAVIENLKPHLDKGDIIIDGGNSFYTDTDRRFEYLAKDEIHFFGSGVSGGAKGARRGPSIMPGGDKAAYEYIKPIFEAASAKVNGEPCVAHLGNGSAGNYVKMVHNGIEYGLMQLISEAYDLMKNVLGMSNAEMKQVFEEWNASELGSFLVEITADILGRNDDEGKGELVDAILDKAKQKGTGKWTSQNAMDLGMPIPTIDASVRMREISSFKDLRVEAAKLYPKNTQAVDLTVIDIKEALYLAYILTYAQGLQQLTEASKEYNYGLNLEVIAKIWRGGCIIRATFLEEIRQAYDRNPDLTNLLMDSKIADVVKPLIPSLEKTSSAGMAQGIPVSAFAASLNYFNAFRSDRLPLNLIQAQRDHFGSHTYERLDKPGIFHTEWED
ncbi:MAG: NADP-dependent phosphogluconate dehydrogenase [Cytophagia bacterium]|nr:NADP-dependent phosphogluconate dehydrogenase [Cytophagia bacterium]